MNVDGRPAVRAAVVSVSDGSTEYRRERWAVLEPVELRIEDSQYRHSNSAARSLAVWPGRAGRYVEAAMARMGMGIGNPTGDSTA